MNTQKKGRLTVTLINFLIFSVFYIFHFSGNISLKIASAQPILCLSLLVAVSMFSSEWSSAFAGLVLGFFFDSVSSSSSVFNTVIMFIIGLGVSLITHYIFNNNILSAAALSVISSVIYFLLMWLLFYGIGKGAEQSAYYLFRIAVPSAVYTAVFIFPFYFLERALFKKFTNN